MRKTSPDTSKQWSGSGVSRLDMVVHLLAPVLAFILAGLLVFLLAGCQSAGGGPSSGKPSTPVLIQQQTADIQQAHDILVTGKNSVLAMFDSLTATNFMVQVPLIKARVVEADSHIQDGLKAAPEIQKSSEADHATVETQGRKIEKLEKADPQVAWLNWVGLGLLVLGFAAIGAGIWLNIPMLRNGGFSGAGVALAILTLATFLRAIEWLIAGIVAAALCGAVVYYILHRKVINAKIKDAEGWVKTDPSVTMTPPLPPPTIYPPQYTDHPMTSTTFGGGL